MLPSVAAAPDGTFLVAWGTGTDIEVGGLFGVTHAQCFSPSGEKSGPELQITTQAVAWPFPAAAWLTNEVFVVATLSGDDSVWVHSVDCATTEVQKLGSYEPGEDCAGYSGPVRFAREPVGRLGMLWTGYKTSSPVFTYMYGGVSAPGELLPEPIVLHKIVEDPNFMDLNIWGQYYPVFTHASNDSILLVVPVFDQDSYTVLRWLLVSDTGQLLYDLTPVAPPEQQLPYASQLAAASFSDMSSVVVWKQNDLGNMVWKQNDLGNSEWYIMVSFQSGISVPTAPIVANSPELNSGLPFGLGDEARDVPSVAVLDNDEFVVVWSANDPKEPEWSIYAQRFTKDGKKLYR